MSATGHAQSAPIGVPGGGRLATAAKWLFLASFLVSSTLFGVSPLPIFAKISPAIDALSLCAFSLIHCTGRYGLRTTLTFLGLTWAVSCGLEISSVHNGFPFGLYSYVNAPPPLVLGVPVATGAVYFGMAYVSWMLSLLLLGEDRKPLQGLSIVAAPVVAAFIMVMWDYCLDPVFSTVFAVWVWPRGGSYFGVPLSNYAGWMLSAYLIFQLFALFLGRSLKAATSPGGRAMWWEIIVAYFLQGFLFVLFAVCRRTDHVELYRSMALAFTYTMLFVVILASLAVGRRDRDVAGP